MNKKEIFEILRKELVVALGCTEPIAIAYATAVAVKFVKKGSVVHINVNASSNVLKNALAVKIPGAGEGGINLAAALGSLSHDTDSKLELLKGISYEDVVRAKSIVQSGVVMVEKANSEKRLYIEIIVVSLETKARVVIEDKHTNITIIEVNGVRQDLRNFVNEPLCDTDETYAILNIETILQFVNLVDIKELSLINESILLNKAIADEGLAEDYGLQVGKTLYSGRLGKESIDIADYAMALTAAASDARMAGSILPVMSNSGSGNQGISATLPIVAIAERMGIAADHVIRSVALSHLITIYIKSKFGRLSAFCGVTISATGASCGISFLLGGGIKEIKASIQNMLGNVTGMLCDGAKAGCALKVSTCTYAAIQAALLALKGIEIQATDGIIGKDPEETIINMCKIANLGSLEADKIILDIMLAKANC